MTADQSIWCGSLCVETRRALGRAPGLATQAVKITKGWSNGKAAVILFDGESSVLKLTGEAILVNEGGTWRVDDELTDVVMK